MSNISTPNGISIASVIQFLPDETNCKRSDRLSKPLKAALKIRNSARGNPRLVEDTAALTGHQHGTVRPLVSSLRQQLLGERGGEGGLEITPGNGIGKDVPERAVCESGGGLYPLSPAKLLLFTPASKYGNCVC